MALNQVQVVGRPQPRQPVQKKDDMQKILEGLQVAGGILGIGVNYTTIQNHMKQNDALDATAAGILPEKERLDAQTRGLKPAEEGAPGAQSYKFASDAPEGFSKQAFILQPKEPGPVQLHAVNNYRDPKTGAYGTAFIDPNHPEGGVKTFVPQEKPEVAKEPSASWSAPVQGSDGQMWTTNARTGESRPVTGADGVTFGKAKTATPDQFKAGSFAKRMDQAEGVFSELTDQGFDRAGSKAGLQSFLPGAIKPEDLKRQDQAERNFVNALLRRESGSAISSGEFDSAEKQYFPRAGDTQKVLEQKAQNRQQSTAAMAAEAGPAMQAIPTVASKSSGPKGGGGQAQAAPAAPPVSAIEAELARRGLKPKGASGGY